MSESKYFYHEERPNIQFFVSAGRCREFMRGIAPPQLWEPLQEHGEWGGHLHRAILGAALTEAPDEDMVDLLPAYANAVIADHKGRIDVTNNEEEDRDESYRYIYQAIMWMDYERFRNYTEMHGRTPDPLEMLESSLGYFDQAKVPRKLLDEYRKPAS